MQPTPSPSLADTFDHVLSPLSPCQGERARERGRGAPEGNKNALKHGRRFQQVIDARSALHQLRKVPAVAASPDSELDKAFRWSRYEAAALNIAIHKKAELVRYYLAAVAAMQNGEPVPPQPAVFLSAREDGLYRIYIEQQKLLRAFGGASFGQEPTKPKTLQEIATLALGALEEWQLASNALDNLSLLAIGIVPATALPRLRRLAAAPVQEKFEHHCEVSAAVPWGQRAERSNNSNKSNKQTTSWGI
ncbi:MAG: hypothetical protein WEB00_14475 [Dehalococcoidia bacterium]